MDDYKSVYTAFDELSAEDQVRMTAGSANRVDTYVYIGGYLIASDPRYIKKEGIKRIVKLFPDSVEYPGGYHRHPGVKYLVLPAADVPNYDIRPDAFAAVRFIKEGILRNEKILVHCHAGISRSATIVLFHLMINSGYDLDMAIARLLLVRSFIRPNPGFMEHLRATDARLRRLRVGDEYRVASQQEVERPYIAPLPIFAGDVAPLLLANRKKARGAYHYAGADEPPGASVYPIAPPGPPIPGGGLISFDDPYENDMPS